MTRKEGRGFVASRAHRSRCGAVRRRKGRQSGSAPPRPYTSRPARKRLTDACFEASRSPRRARTGIQDERASRGFHGRIFREFTPVYQDQRRDLLPRPDLQGALLRGADVGRHPGARVGARARVEKEQARFRKTPAAARVIFHINQHGAVSNTQNMHIAMKGWTRKRVQCFGHLIPRRKPPAFVIDMSDAGWPRCQHGFRLSLPRRDFHNKPTRMLTSTRHSELSSAAI